MPEARWEWSLPGPVRIVATIDDTVETVLVDETVASRAERGHKREGHVVELPRRSDDDPSDPARVATVRFDASGRICVLTLDGLEISPASWPTSKKAPIAHPPAPAFPMRILAVSAMAAAVVMAVVLFSRTRAASRASAETDMTGVYRAPNGRFVAHYPSGFAAKTPVTPKSMSAVVLEDRTRGDAVVVLAAKAVEPNDVPWTLHKRLYGEALASLARATPDHEETKREDGTCLGEPGAVVVARVTNAKREKARVHSCAFSHAGGGYLIAWMIRESASADEEARIARLVEGTELTQLYDMSDQP